MRILRGVYSDITMTYNVSSGTLNSTIPCYIWYSKERTGQGHNPPGPSSLYQMYSPPINAQCNNRRCCAVLMFPLKG